MVIKFIKKYINILFNICEKLIIWFGNQFKNTDFLTNHSITLISFLALYFYKEEFYNSYLYEGKFSLSSVNFIYYPLLYFSIIMMMYSGYLINYVYYIRDNEIKLKKTGYIKFLEDEYKVTYEPFLKGIGFFITLLISGTAIYMTLISMQSSLDVASGTLNGEIDLKNTLEMFKTLGLGLAITIFIFVICFFYYRFSIFSKNNYVKKIYYDTYIKKTNK